MFKLNLKTKSRVTAVVRSALSKTILVSSLITILILVSTIFFELPKWIIFLFVVILIFQPIIIVFFNDRNKCK
jgi:hypothetical protein